jgi:hypothetical protein
VASGDLLAFIDADSQVHPETFNEIDRVLSDPHVVGGTTGIEFERMSAGIKLTSMMLLMAGNVLRLSINERLTTEIDSGVAFCRRSDFTAIGGYSEERLFAEDAQLLLDLQRLGRKRGQRLARRMNARALFSTRKFDRYGDWHYFPLSFRMLWSMLRRGGVRAWARQYWYEQR